MHELLEKLRNLDEITLVELLGITSDDLVDSFLDRIDENFEYLSKELDFGNQEEQDR
jgi:hypothetical protein